MGRRLFVVGMISVVLAAGSVAAAQPPPDGASGAPVPAAPPPSTGPPASPARGEVSDPSVALREANVAALAGDWARVAALVTPLLARALQPADLAEAHRLSGIAALFAQPPRPDLAEQHFLALLRLDLDATIDPALYPPEVVQVFSDVRARHVAELRARRPRAKRYLALTLLPPLAQLQNGDRARGIVIGALLGTFAAANLTSFLVLRSWCDEQVGPSGTSAGCDRTSNRNASATTLRSLNLATGVALIVTYLYGVYDGVRGYRRTRPTSTLVPYATSTNTGATLGVSVQF